MNDLMPMCFTLPDIRDLEKNKIRKIVVTINNWYLEICFPNIKIYK